MHLDQIVRRFDSLAHQGLVYRLSARAALGVMQESEARLGVKFPEQVRAFWRAFDGLDVDNPPFKILSTSEMKREGDFVVFCFFDRIVTITFHVTASNDAPQ